MFSIFNRIYSYFKSHRIVFITMLLVCLTLAGISIATIQFEEDFTKVLPFRKEVKVYNDVLSNSDFLNRLIFTVSFEEDSAKLPIDSLVAFTKAFTDTAKKQLVPEYIKDIKDKTDQDITAKLYDVFYENMPLYFTVTDYKKISHLLHSDSMDQAVYRAYKNLLSPSGMITRKFLLKDPFNLVLPHMEKLGDIRVDQSMELYNGYFLSRETQQLFFFMLPQKTGDTKHQKELVLLLEKQIQDFARVYPDIKVHYYGAAAIAAANANRIEKDIKLTVTLVMIFLVVWLSTFFRNYRAVFLVFLPVLLGAITGMAALASLTDTVSVLSVAIGAVILGVTIDYSLHLVTHYKLSGNIKETIQQVAPPLLMSSLTTGTAFLCLIFLTSKILQDLGIFASFSVFGAALASIIVIPQMLKATNTEKPQKTSQWLSKIASFPFHQQKWLIAIVLIIAATLIPFAGNVDFEGDLEKSNYLSPQLSEAREKINNASSVNQQLIYVFSNGENLSKALSNAERVTPMLKATLGAGAETDIYSITRLLPSLQTQQQKIETWNKFWTPEKKDRFSTLVNTSAAKYGFKTGTFQPLLAKIGQSYSPQPPTTLAESFNGLLSDFIIPQGDSILVTTLVRSEDSEVKEKVYTLTAGFETTTAFDRKRITEQLFNFLKEDFSKLVWYSMGAVFIILLLFFGRIELAIATYIPIILSYGCTLGIMGITGIKFNIFNIIISTFIFGLGVDYAIFITRGLLNEYKTGHKDLSAFKLSILLSAISTLLGIGVLIFAKHPALQSIALLSIVGIVSALLISFIIQPLIISFIIPVHKKKHKIPLTISTLFFSVAAFLFFGLSSLILSIFGMILRILPLPEKPIRHFYNYLLCYSNKLLVKLYYPVKKRYINFDKNTLREPGIIVANHQSVIDLLFIISLSPKVIMLVKDWVWNSFFFGSVVRTAGYINTSEGYEAYLPLIKERMREGYSVIIFPEGSRTRTGRIRRFHKGAFYIAQQLNVPVRPLLIHGAFEILPPGRFIVANKVFTICFLPKILLNNSQTYQENTKTVQNLMRDEFQRLKETYEDTRFYKSQLLNNYLFKGPVIENYQRVKFRMEGYYARFDTIIPAQARIYDYGCGMGALSIMLSYLSAGRRITGLDYDENKIEIARNCRYNAENVEFLHTDILTFIPEKADVFVLSDVLHYLTAENQEKLMKIIVGQLNTGGSIVIRDGNMTQKEKHGVTKFSEFLSTNIGFNKKTQDFHFISGDWLQEIAKQNNLSLKLEHASQFTSNQLHILTKSGLGNGQ